MSNKSHKSISHESSSVDDLHKHLDSFQRIKRLDGSHVLVGKPDTTTIYYWASVTPDILYFSPLDADYIIAGSRMADINLSIVQ